MTGMTANEYTAKFEVLVGRTSFNEAALEDSFIQGLPQLILQGLLSRMGFPTRLKSKRVEIGKEKMSRMIVKEKLSERAVVKERRLG